MRAVIAPRRTVVLLLVLCTAASTGPVGAASASFSVERTELGILVSAPGRRITIVPDNGGRIVSLELDGVEWTRLSEDGHGGLIEETHTADCPFRVAQMHAGPPGAVVRLEGDAGPLRVVKEYRFSADSPNVLVNLTFENRSPYVLTGARAPAVRNLATPSPGAAGGEVFCMDRGAGTEVMAAGLFLARPDGPGPFRWMGVADPAVRRTLGVAVLDGGCRPLPPLRTPEGMVTAGWSCPPLPPGCRMSVRVLLAPLDGFASLAEMNEHFACDSVPFAQADPPETQFTLRAFTDGLKDASVTTRTHDAQHREIGLSDPLLLHDPQPGGRAVGGVVRWDADEAAAWLVHEVYARGRKLAQFAVPLGGGPRVPPPAPATPPPPVAVPVADAHVPAPGSLITLDAEAERRGFVLWVFDGPPAEAQPDRLSLTMGRGGRRTVFLGVRALAPTGRLHIAVEPAEAPADAAAPIPQAAVSVWRIVDGADSEPQMVPPGDLTMASGEVAWVALTFDAGLLDAGRYGASLTAASGGGALRVPVLVEVLDAGPYDADAFPVWYLPPGPDAVPSNTAQAKLRAYDVAAFTLPMASGAAGRVALEAAGQAERRGWAFLAFSGAGAGAQPPAGGFPVRLALPHPRPPWLLDVRRAARGAARAAALAGFRPALLCERPDALDPDALPGPEYPSFLLVSDGCGPQDVPLMRASERIGADDAVWLHMDLRRADWRHAALEVRSAFWAAAWQGMAGAAVSGPEPFREADRQSPIWHIVRDARQEVALWRTVRRRAAEAASAAAGPEALRAVALAEGAVGPEQGHDLRVGPQRRPFRTVLRAAHDGAGQAVRLGTFERVHRANLELAGRLPATARPRPGDGQIYWDGIPLVTDDRVRWVIVAPDGEEVWKRGLELQALVQQAGGRAVPVRRTMPEPEPDAPLLVWVVGGAETVEEWPEALRAQWPERQGGSLALLGTEGGPRVVVVGADADLQALARGFRPSPRTYPSARDMR